MDKTAFKTHNALIRFINNDSNFRFAFIGAFFFASLCLIRDWFYIAAGIMMIWGAYLTGYKYIFKGYILRVRNRKLLYIFLGLSLFTALLHLSNNLVINLYMLVYMTECFVLFYGLHAGRSRNKAQHEMQKMLDFLNTSTFIVMIAGLVLLIIFPSGFVINGDSFAIHENRFVGILFNANVTAFYSLMGIIYCNLLWVIKKSVDKLTVKIRIWYIVCMVIHILSLFLTDSNDSILMLIVYGCFIAFYVLFRGYKPTILNFIFRIIALALSCALIAAVILGARILVQEGVSALFKMFESPAKVTEIHSPSGNVVVKPNPQKVPTTFEHQNTNLDSGRFVIWKQSIGLFGKFPLFGIGKANIVDYGKKYLGGLKYEDFHNGLITIIISCGMTGFFVFMVLAVTIAKTMLKAIFRYRKENRRDGRVLMYITAFCAGYCIYSMFEVALLADLSYRVLIFWMLIGYAMSYTNSYENHAVRAHDNISDRTRSIYRIACYKAMQKQLPHSQK